MPSMGGWEWVILALIALLLFGGSRLAGIGKNAGKAIREFKEETATLRSSVTDEPVPPVTAQASAQPAVQPAVPSTSPVEPEPETDTETKS
ncbi:MAG TPA: twin-arginine translocase TatA/TatE family subunit [Propionicimonas sp.]|nr:twin-arginine translocase TatA/TatE family subunit [Propionicimonas sp.]